MTAQTRILVADDDPILCLLLKDTLQDAGFDVLVAHNGDELVRMAQEHSPGLLLIDLMMPIMDGYEAIRQLRNDTRTAHLPMIILTARSATTDVVSGFETGADDYIVKPYDTNILVARIRGHLRRAAQRPVHNPLTGLPGNILLQAELEHRLSGKHKFALLYVDLDNFKAFNDAYGFSRGDRAIHLLADVLSETVADADFLGHIGGDDFAIIHSMADVELLCRSLITAFDQRVVDLYDKADRDRGYLLGIDRQGHPRKFSLLSVSIAVVSTYWRDFQTVEEMTKAVAELKNQAKTIPGSTYIFDRRRKLKRLPSRERRGQRLPRALLICSNPSLAARLGDALRSQRYRVLRASDIVEAHTLLARMHDVSLLVSELGQDTAIWDLWHQFEKPPALITITTDTAAAASARNAGAYAVVSSTEDDPEAVAKQILLYLQYL